MSDDDLEERLTRLRPAAPPRDMLRDLRAAEPPAHGGMISLLVNFLRDGWGLRAMVLAGAVALAALVAWQAAFRQAVPPSVRVPAAGGSGGQTAASPLLLPAGGSAPWADARPVAFEVDAAAGQPGGLGLPPDEAPGGRYAFLTDLVLRPADALHLGLPTGPVRLDSGYRLFDRGPDDGPGDNFSLGKGEPF